MFKRLEDWLTWQETLHPKSWDLGLQRIGAVWEELGAPRLAERIISVAGTNGKGSCVRWTEEICHAHNITVASFSSPHLRDYRERIRFDNEMISEEQLVNAFKEINRARGKISLTYFEWSALAAFYLMALKKPQVAVLEVGLGGRLDAVNLIDADATIFTRIGLDHQNWLGNDIETIAIEKAGIMREKQLVYFADKNPPLALKNRAAMLNAQVFSYGKDFHFASDLPLPTFMHGAHQLGHFAAVQNVLATFFTLENSALIQTLATTKNDCRLMHLTHGGKNYLLDVAHNEDSAEVLANYLQSLQKKTAIICSILHDKDQVAIFKRLAPVANSFYLLPLENPRASTVDELRQNAITAGIPAAQIHLCTDIKHAIQSANDDLNVVMGSFITVNLALEFLK